MPSGSYLVVSHWAADLLGRDTKDSLQDIGSRMVQQSLALRSREQVAQFFTGTDLVAPGLVRVEEWRPEPGMGDTGRSSLWCVVGCMR